ncbi:reverse transcriptase [Cucumis melo var. makuwa]|uniref:Reverse transcriptase n=1 Tax=Cucumis melo var. makuwa TaxID=1194695 RepID=A0A5A7VQ66_CUCMM|nr:reverse transcriptase [Cucumis melo var. makuwa]
MSLNISSSYHPQTDGQTERFNCMLKEYLRHFVNSRQKNWVQLLDVAQFCFNAQTSSELGEARLRLFLGGNRYCYTLLIIPMFGRTLKFRGWKDQRLIRKYEEPVEVLKKVGNASYRVALPTWMKIYPVIHVSNLKPYHQDTEDLQQNVVICLIIDLSQKEDKDVEEILAERVRRGRRPTRRIHEYLIKWKNLPVEETSWKRVEDLEA